MGPMLAGQDLYEKTDDHFRICSAAGGLRN
jgi:hypothetical protein